MNDKDVKPQLMKLLGISDENIADKVLHYAKLINDGTTTNLVNSDKKKNAQELLDALRANSFALAKELNVRAEKIIDLIATAYQRHSFEATSIDTAQLNKSYVLLVNELEKLYSKNKELSDIEKIPAWKYFGIIEGAEWEINEYIYENRNDTGQSHIAQINRLCIIAGTDKPKVMTDNVKKILQDADTAISAYSAKLDEEKKKTASSDRNWYIPEYKVTYGLDGTILVNGVLKLKKVHAGSVPDKLMEQVTKNPNKVTKPDLGQTTRNLSTVLSSMGFTGTIRQLFFPSVSKDKGVLFRPAVSDKTAKDERIDTTELDTKLKKLGASTRLKPTEIPF
jgi:hypothetical protein